MTGGGAREAVGAQTGENDMANDRGCSESCPCWGQPFERPRVCPLCGHIFAGKGWDGIDAHYKSKHGRDTGIEYEQWWFSICPGHTG